MVLNRCCFLARHGLFRVAFWSFVITGDHKTTSFALPLLGVDPYVTLYLICRLTIHRSEVL